MNFKWNFKNLSSGGSYKHIARTDFHVLQLEVEFKIRMRRIDYQLKKCITLIEVNFSQIMISSSFLLWFQQCVPCSARNVILCLAVWKYFSEKTFHKYIQQFLLDWDVCQINWPFQYSQRQLMLKPSQEMRMLSKSISDC